jgi:class 3 adenylate cyclase
MSPSNASTASSKSAETRCAALFGAPVSHEDDPERAVRAAIAIRAAIDRLNDDDPNLDLHVRVGVNTGEALVVLGADAARGEGMASGDVVNTAARLQAAAPVDGILVGAQPGPGLDRLPGGYGLRPCAPRRRPPGPSQS